jgi:hypothetical protein
MKPILTLLLVIVLPTLVMGYFNLPQMLVYLPVYFFAMVVACYGVVDHVVKSIGKIVEDAITNMDVDDEGRITFGVGIDDEPGPPKDYSL